MYGVFQKFDEVLGLDQIAVFHINDSMNLLGAHKDRHANIGAGTIGFDTLYKVVHDERFLDVPKILETPWLCAEGETKKAIPPYKEEISRLLGYSNSSNFYKTFKAYYNQSPRDYVTSGM